MRRTSQLWNSTIGTKRRPSPHKGGRVHIRGHLRKVRGTWYVEINWSRYSGWVRYSDLRLL